MEEKTEIKKQELTPIEENQRDNLYGLCKRKAELLREMKSIDEEITKLMKNII